MTAARDARLSTPLAGTAHLTVKLDGKLVTVLPTSSSRSDNNSRNIVIDEDAASKKHRLLKNGAVLLTFEPLLDKFAYLIHRYGDFR